MATVDLEQSDTEGNRDIVRVSYDPEVIDQSIRPDDIAIVHKYLAKHSVKWYDIGLYLRIPKEKLDEIDEDHRRVSRKLTEMIDEWMKNSVNCTWRALMMAVQDCDQTDTYNTVSIQASEIVVKHKKLKQMSSANTWEEKEKSLKELQVTFQMLLLLADTSRADCIVRLCGHFGIPNNVSDETKPMKIELFIPMDLIHTQKKIDTITQPFVDTISRFLQNQECLEVWSSLLITEIKEVCDTLHPANLKQEAISIDYNGQDATEKLEVDATDASGYVQSLNHDLNVCLKSINKTIKQTEYIQALSASYRRYLSVTISLLYILLPTIMLYALCFIPYLTQSSTAAIIIPIIAIIAAIRLLHSYEPGVLLQLKKALVQITTALNYLIVRHMAITYAISGALLTSVIYTYLRMFSDSKAEATFRTEETPNNFPPYTFPIIVAAAIYTIYSGITQMKHFNLMKNIILSFFLGRLAITVIRACLGYTSKRRGFLASTFLAAILLYLYFHSHLETNLMWAVVGLLSGAALPLKTVLNLMANPTIVPITIIFIVISTAASAAFMLFIGRLIYKHEVVDYITLATTGLLAGLCLVAFLKRFMLSLKFFDDPTAKSMTKLKKSLDKLQSIKESTLLHQDLLHNVH